jgi:hypothetical protein
MIKVVRMEGRDHFCVRVYFRMMFYFNSFSLATREDYKSVCSVS